MSRFPFIKQFDSRQCGAACLTMICHYYGIMATLSEIESRCGTSKDGISMLALKNVASYFGFDTIVSLFQTEDLNDLPHPMVLFWDKKHFVVLYRIKKNTYYVADPAKGCVKYPKAEFQRHWISTTEIKGIAMLLAPANKFIINKNNYRNNTENTYKFLWKYISKYKKYFIHIFLGLTVGSILQLILPFLTQAIVDVGIKHNDINLIWLILLGELMIVFGRTVTDFVRRWLLLHISMRINVSLVSDYFIKLLKLPMSFFETKLIGDLIQRMSDHNRVQVFLTNQSLNIVFSTLNLIIFGIVLFVYNPLIFLIYMAASLLYGLWNMLFLNKRRFLDYELFEQQAKNHSKTYQFLNCIQEIKLQNCEKRRRFEWEDIQADSFDIELKAMRIKQIQEAIAIFINELKNILITILSATSVISGDISLGAMLAIQYVVGQLNSPLEQLMVYLFSIQDVSISLSRINDIHKANEEQTNNMLDKFHDKKTLVLKMLVLSMIFML